MQAIITKYIGPTNSRGARIKAECERGKIFFSYPYELSGDACHRAAVDALTDKFAKEDRKAGEPIAGNPWKADYVTGQIPSGQYVHVFTEGGREQ
jgi:hypothetical protein